jgi:hypothetical protein
MKFISLEKSNKPNKKFVITISEPKLRIHFGSKNSFTYLIGTVSTSNVLRTM